MKTLNKNVGVPRWVARHLTHNVGAMPMARPGATENNGGYCTKRRATHRVAPTGFGVYDPAEAGRVGVVGVKQGASALPAFDLRGSKGNMASKGKAGETFALPLQNRVNRWADPAEVGRAGV